MTTKELTDNKEKVISGLKKAAEVVASTMGAGGNTVAIFDNLGELRFTKDGVSVAKSIALEDEIENIGAQLLINSANKTVEEVGDGTTTTSVLLKEMVNLNIPVEDIEQAIPEVVKRLTEDSVKITTVDEIEAIATIASNSPRLGKLLAEIYHEVGFDAFVNLNYGVSSRTEYVVKQGFEFNSGYISPRFATERGKDTVTFNNALIVIDEKKSSDPDSYVKIMETASVKKKPLVIISPEFSSSVIRLVLHNVQNNFPVCLVKAPGFGKQVDENYEDLRAIVSEEGTVDEIVIGPTSFTIYNENCNNLEERIKLVQAQLNASYIEEHDHYFINNRLNKLKGTTAILYAGGVTEKNMKEEYDRLEDAIGAVKAALKSGYVRGGGYALLNATFGTKIGALGVAPCHQILKNAGLPISPEMPEQGKEINVKTNKEEDFLKTGIIDPVDVVIQALVNATASYRLLNETKYIIYNEQSQKNPLFGG